MQHQPLKFVDQPYHLMLRILKVDGDTKKWNDDLKGTKFGLFSSKTCNSASMLDKITINSAAGARFSTRLAVGKPIIFRRRAQQQVESMKSAVFRESSRLQRI